MPSTSKKQEIAMAIAAKGKSNIGIPQSVGQEFHAADVAKKAEKPNAAKSSHEVLSHYLDHPEEH